jgi:hypothetical protein
MEHQTKHSHPDLKFKEELAYLTIYLRLYDVTSSFPRTFLKAAEPHFEVRRKKKLEDSG